MHLLRRLVKTVLVLVLVFVGIGLLLPRQVHVERSTEIAAGPEVIFPILNDLRRFNEWSPWFALDPDAEYRFAGPATGVGARAAWKSERPQVGTGSQEIVASRPPSHVQTHLDFGDRGTALATFNLAASGSGTRVTWGFDVNFGYDVLGRWMGLMFDRWIGRDYEAGLSNLKDLVEDEGG
jgi:hypothetical protein